MTATGRRVASLLGVTALVVSGCGGHSSGHSGGHSHSTPRKARSSEFTSVPNVSLGHDPVARGPITIHGGSKGGRVTVLTSHGLRGSLDPTAASAPDVVSILGGLVTRSLTEYRYDPTEKQMVLVPDLATNLGSHNDDYTRWDYTIRGHARFEDGSRIGARAVARGIRRCRDTREFPTSPCRGVPIRKVKVRYLHEVDVFLSRSYPTFPYLAALPALGPMPLGGTADPATYARHPLASGPYRISSYRRGHRLVLVRNPQWDPATDPGRTAYPTSYDVRAGLSDRRIDHLLRADHGSARTTLTYDAVRPHWWLRSRERQRRLVEGATPCTTYLAPDNRVITDPRVRRALIWAYPYRTMLRLEGLTPGVTAVPATNLLPPGIGGRVRVTVRGHRGFATQPLVSRRILAKAGALGTPLTLAWGPGTPTGNRERDALLAALRRGGFAPQAVRPGLGATADLQTRTWCGSWPDGSAWLVPLYQPASGADVEHFTSRYVALQVDRIVHAPLDQQPQLWNKVDHQVLRRSQPVVPLWYSGVAMAHGSAIQGMADDTILGMPAWTGLWVRQ
jgi:peptide/nickel transport system substrate-binding protein